MRTLRLRIIALAIYFLLASSFPLIAQTNNDPASPDNTAMASSSAPTVPSLEDLGLPPAQNQDQNTPPPNNQQNNEPSLSDLGFAANQTQGSAQEQARLNKRTHMLKVHQTLGLITLIPMVATLAASGGAKLKKGTVPGTYLPPDQTSLDLHVALGATTGAMYTATAYYAIFAPKIPGVKPRGAIRIHKYLEYVHGPGMVLTGILGILAYNQEEAGQKVHGIAAAHGPVADVTVAAYAASIVAVSWPIKLKFWEGQ